MHFQVFNVPNFTTKMLLYYGEHKVKDLSWSVFIVSTEVLTRCQSLGTLLATIACWARCSRCHRYQPNPQPADGWQLEWLFHCSPSFFHNQQVSTLLLQWKLALPEFKPPCSRQPLSGWISRLEFFYVCCSFWACWHWYLSLLYIKI